MDIEEPPTFPTQANSELFEMGYRSEDNRERGEAARYKAQTPRHVRWLDNFRAAMILGATIAIVVLAIFMHRH